jgi:hypothetical protein
MRTLGQAEKALEMMCRRGLSREAFGKPLVKLGGNFDIIAKARLDIDAARLMVFRAARAMDVLGTQEARIYISGIKAMVPEISCRIIDQAIQMFGAAGVSQWTPLARMYTSQRTLRLADGPDEVHRMVVARAELARYTGQEAPTFSRLADVGETRKRNIQGTKKRGCRTNLEGELASTPHPEERLEHEGGEEGNEPAGACRERGRDGADGNWELEGGRSHDADSVGEGASREHSLTEPKRRLMALGCGFYGGGKALGGRRGGFVDQEIGMVQGPLFVGEKRGEDARGGRTTKNTKYAKVLRARRKRIRPRRAFSTE